MSLESWQERLQAHFTDLKRQKSLVGGGMPVFALEHGLSAEELEELEIDIRAHIDRKAPSRNHILPWIVYASEIGYNYDGNEYWQTFENKTPGWATHGDRYWIQACFRIFSEMYGGAKPTGTWANHFTIICWPITHAIIPLDLQRQLARVLYEARNHFSQEVFDAPTVLGDLVAARTVRSWWHITSRFQNFVQQPELVGQIAAALLMEGESGSENLILPITLQRISEALDRRRQDRDWLQRARKSAQRYEFRGLSTGGLGVIERMTLRPSIESAREQVSALALEPRLLLQPVSSNQWRILLEVPDFSHLLAKFPTLRPVLGESRCAVSGSSGKPLARGRVLYGKQKVVIHKWPNPQDVLLEFDPPLTCPPKTDPCMMLDLD